MEQNSLKLEIAQVIMGTGMGGSTQYLQFICGYFDKIIDPIEKDRVLALIVELAKDFENQVSSRALYLVGELPVTNKKTILIDIVHRLNPILDSFIDNGTMSESSMAYLDYLCEMNKLISKFRIEEARPFLEKQTRFLCHTMPQPPSIEYYVYHLSAKTAERSLSILDSDA